MKLEKQKTQAELDSLKRVAGANPDQKTQLQIESLEGNIKWWDTAIPVQENSVAAARNQAAGANVAVVREVTPEEIARRDTARAYIRENQAATATPKPVSITPYVSTPASSLSSQNSVTSTITGNTSK